MSYLYWIIVFMSIFSFGIISADKYKRYKGKWYWLFAFFYASAVCLSTAVSLKRGIIVAIVLLLGNILLWSMIWSFSRGIMFSIKMRNIAKEADKKLNK